MKNLDLDEFNEWFEEAEWLFDEVRKRREAAIKAAGGTVVRY